MSSSSEQRPLPEVLIAGAGLGGLLMAILLDKIGIPYRILERASKVKALGIDYGLVFLFFLCFSHVLLCSLSVVCSLVSKVGSLSIC